jgi:5-methylcytosine-specific restriction endonuclease McrA
MAKWHESNEWRVARAYAKTVLDPVCVVCTKELIGSDWTIDHIVPPGEGLPNHDINNLQSMCRECNSRKSDKVQQRINWLNPKWFA